MKRRTGKGTAGVAVRGMKSRDIAAAVGVFMRTYREQPYREVWRRPAATRYLRRVFRLEPESCLVAVARSRVAGVLIGYTYPYRGNRLFHILELFVDRRFRRKGLGRALLARAAAGETVFTIFAHNRAPAMKFYRRVGFRSPEHYRFYYSRVAPGALGSRRKHGHGG